MSRLSILVIFLPFVLYLNAFSQPANLYTFLGPDVDLGQGATFSSGMHYIGGRVDTVYVLRVTPGGSVYCHKSTDAGRTFSSGVEVNLPFSGGNPSLKVNTSGVIYVAYQSGDADIYFTKSTDGGQTFTQGVKVNDDTIPQIGQERPAIAVNNKGQIFVAWRDQRNMPPPTARNLFTASSFDGGQSFTPNVQANEVGTYLNGSIDIATDDSGRVYTAYQGYSSDGKYGIVMCTSVDSGENYTSHVLVSDLPFGSGLLSANDPSIALFNRQLVGTAWQDLRFNQVSLRFSISSDYAQSFSPSVVVDSSGQPQYPSLVWSHATLYVVWRATHRRAPTGPDLDHIWFSYSRDSGKTFVPFVDVVPDDTNEVVHSFPTLWVSETEKVYVAWGDTRCAPPPIY